MPVNTINRLPARPKPSGAAAAGTVSGTGPITNPYAGLREEFEQPIGPQLTPADLEALFRRTYQLSEGSRRGAALGAVQRAGGDVSSPYYAQQAGALAAGSAANAARSLTDVHLADLYRQQDLERLRRQGLAGLAGAEGSFNLAGRGQLFGESQYRDSREDYERDRSGSSIQRQLAQLQAMYEMQNLQNQMLQQAQGGILGGNPFSTSVMGGGGPMIVGDPSFREEPNDMFSGDFHNDPRFFPPELGTRNPNPRQAAPSQPTTPTGPDTPRQGGGNADYGPGYDGSFASSAKTRKPKRAYAGM